MMTQVSNFIIPAVIFLVVGFGVLGHVKIYESFLKGASDGLKIVVEIVPTLIGLMMGVGILRASGFFTLLERALAPVAALFGFPAQILSLLTVKLFSSSAATGLVLDVFATYGPDSYPGLITSIVMSCTETVFYTMSVYFLAAKVTKTRYTLTGALLSTAAGTIAGILLAAAIV
ncbi:MAG: spore maturation protein [Lachnospiraceae bacterium]|jgi:spore maturation protein B|nr:spore maturation protein [Lachnospiraceae bacterium]